MGGSILVWAPVGQPFTGCMSATTMPRSLKRKNIRLRPENYRGQQLYFLTLCFHNRARTGADSRLASWLIERMRSHAETNAFLVHAYSIMPDHVHLLAHGAKRDSDLLKFVEAFKQDTGFHFHSRTSRRLWQFKYYDHIVRKPEDAQKIARYIWMNPVRKGLCSAPHDYPFSGSLTDSGTAMFGRPSEDTWTPPWKSRLPL